MEDDKKISRKARRFQLTLNQVGKWPELLDYLKSLKTLGYLLACKEVAPATGHEHIHCYVQFESPIALSLKKAQGAHIETCNGTPQANIDYIKKDGNIICELGNLKKQGRYSIKEVLSMKVDERDELPFVYYDKVKSLKSTESNIMDAEDYYKNVTVYYLYGESGAGKTQMAIEKIKELNKEGLIKSTKFNEIKYCNGFWIGVDANSICDVALYDDFRDGHMYPSEFINFIDYNTHNMNIKNGFVKNTFKYIFITSIQSPEELYAKSTTVNEEPKKQWLRRITHTIHVEK
jgi:hypothetical protein